VIATSLGARGWLGGGRGLGDEGEMESYFVTELLGKMFDQNLFDIELRVLRTNNGVALAAVVSTIPAVPRPPDKLAWEHVLGDYLGD
jgi:hypothetical protein